MDNAQDITRIEFTTAPNTSLVLFVSYPRKILLNPAGTPQQSVSLWLEHTTPTPDSFSTPTATPRPLKTLTATLTLSNLGAQISAGTQTLAPTTTSSLPHSISFIVTQDDLFFVDTNGVAIPYRVFLTPSDGEVTPAVVYVRPQPGKKHTTRIGVSIDHAQPTGDSVIQIGVEKSTVSYLRQLGSQICGAPLFISGLITALIGFAIQDWSKRNERWQKQQEEDREIQKDLNTLAGLLDRDPSEGARYYLELQSRPDPKWKELEAKARLENILRQRTKPNELVTVIQLWEIRDDEEEIKNFDEIIGHGNLMELLERISKSSEIDGDWQHRVRVLAEKLRKTS